MWSLLSSTNESGQWSIFRGHKIIYLDDDWVYADNHEPISSGFNETFQFNERPCPRCGQMPVPHPTDEMGMDHCIKNLPGVRAACCGHGVTRGYISFDNDHWVSVPMGEDIMEVYRRERNE